MSLSMEPIPIPPEAAASRPSFRALRVGPPPGISDEECGTVEALVGEIDGMTAYADYWQPTPEQLKVLAAGGFLELIQYSRQMVMHSLTLWPASADRAADYAKQRLGLTNCTCTWPTPRVGWPSEVDPECPVHSADTSKGAES